MGLVGGNRLLRQRGQVPPATAGSVPSACLLGPRMAPALGYLPQFAAHGALGRAGAERRVASLVGGDTPRARDIGWAGWGGNAHARAGTRGDAAIGKGRRAEHRHAKNLTP